MLRQREHLPVCQTPRVWPVFRAGLAKDHRNLLELVHLRRPWEQWPERVKLGNDAAKRENIDRVVITSGAKDILRCPVPSRRHILSEGRGVPDLFHEAKIA